MEASPALTLPTNEANTTTITMSTNYNSNETNQTTAFAIHTVDGQRNNSSYGDSQDDD